MDNGNRYFDLELRAFFKHMWWLIVITLGVVAFGLVMYQRLSDKAANTSNDSTNHERVYESKRVFDYAGMLSDSEENLLENYIKEAERNIKADIVIVILNESLKDYAYSNSTASYIQPEEYVKVYAETFYTKNRFGYNFAATTDPDINSDGVILVDNVFREPETMKIYTWMAGAGRGKQSFGAEQIDRALDKFYEQVDSDYYGACVDWVDYVARHMRVKDGSKGPVFFNPLIVLIGSFVILLIYFLVNWQSKAGDKTTNSSTYIVGKKPDFKVNNDIFINKTLVKHYNPPQSSSGGGGHSGGGGFSGGGHSR